MKSTIEISGQISGNATLAHAIGNNESETKRTMFNGYAITFPTKKEAYKALWQAFKYLKKDKEDAQASRLSYTPKHLISYDASIAKIID